MLYKQAAEVVMTMLKQHLTIGQMDSVGEYMMEHYLRDLLGYYLETMIHENGNYLMGYNRLKNEFHHEDATGDFPEDSFPPDDTHKSMQADSG